MWKHGIRLEKILDLEPEIKYPRCIAGERACPPEDSSGSVGYMELLEILANPNHEEYKEKKRWVRRGFDANFFDPKSFEFKDEESTAPKVHSFNFITGKHYIHR